MVYVALLRGINVGGNNKIDMKQLKATFEAAGMTNVRTYINSGNVIFSDETHTQLELAGILEETIEQMHGFHVAVLIKSMDEMRTVDAVLPREWQNGATMKCDVIFLWNGIREDAVVTDLRIRPEIDDVRTAPGVIIWKVDRANATKSGLLKLIGTPLYRQMTVRNSNTLRKLLAIMEQTGV